VTGRGTDKIGFIDTGNVLPGWDPEVCISVAAAKDIGQLVNMVPQEQVQAIIERVNRQDEEIKAMQRQIKAYETLKAEIEPLEPVAA
jgi:hypothetical protein